MDNTKAMNMVLIDNYTVVQGETYKVVHLSDHLAFLISAYDEIRGIGPLHVTTIEKAREGLVHERKEV